MLLDSCVTYFPGCSELHIAVEVQLSFRWRLGIATSAEEQAAPDHLHTEGPID